jgi:hypothetical protein
LGGQGYREEEKKEIPGRWPTAETESPKDHPPSEFNRSGTKTSMDQAADPFPPPTRRLSSVREENEEDRRDSVVGSVKNEMARLAIFMASSVPSDGESSAAADETPTNTIAPDWDRTRSAALRLIIASDPDQVPRVQFVIGDLPVLSAFAH